MSAAWPAVRSVRSIVLRNRCQPPSSEPATAYMLPLVGSNADGAPTISADRSLANCGYSSSGSTLEVTSAVATSCWFAALSAPFRPNVAVP